MWKRVICVLLLAILAERIVNLSIVLNLFREVQNYEPGKCRIIDGMIFGSEDITVLPNGVALISSGLRYPMIPDHNEGRPGHIYWLDLNEKDPRPKAFSFSSGFDASNFHPHGISYFLEDHDDYSEGAYLFVVNHPFKNSQVEIFEMDFELNMLMHQKTIKDELLHHVNDVVAVAPNSFYGTNDHNCDDTLLLEFFLPIKLSDVVFYNSTTTVIVATGFGFANGINTSPDGKYVYVSDFKTSEIHVLRKNEDFTIEPERIIALNTHPDNIEVDRATGDLWIGCCPELWRLVFGVDVIPSEVLQIKNALSLEPMVTSVYANNGSVLQGTSSAARHGHHLLLGTVIHRTMLCTLE
uniref:Paraoxonase n=1 Tax=Eptatretus burgeri TaxID=7764 RepID=A0A8C4Q8R5_EPTBU